MWRGAKKGASERASERERERERDRERGIERGGERKGGGGDMKTGRQTNKQNEGRRLRAFKTMCAYLHVCLLPFSVKKKMQGL